MVSSSKDIQQISKLTHRFTKEFGVRNDALEAAALAAANLGRTKVALKFLQMQTPEPRHPDVESRQKSIRILNVFFDCCFRQQDVEGARYAMERLGERAHVSAFSRMMLLSRKQPREAAIYARQMIESTGEANHRAAANALNAAISAKDEELGDAVWDWIEAADSVARDKHVYRQRVRFLLLFGRANEIGDMILKASTEGVTIKESDVCRAQMMLECSKGDLKAARSLFDKIPLQDRDVVDASALITACFKSRDVDADVAVELARLMLDMGQPAQHVAAGVALKAATHASNYSLCDRIWKWIEDSKVANARGHRLLVQRIMQLARAEDFTQARAMVDQLSRRSRKSKREVFKALISARNDRAFGTMRHPDRYLSRVISLASEAVHIDMALEGLPKGKRSALMYATALRTATRIGCDHEKYADEMIAGTVPTSYACSIALSCAVESANEALGDKVLAWARSKGNKDFVDEGLRQAHTKFRASFSRTQQDDDPFFRGDSNSTPGAPSGDTHLDISTLDVSPDSRTFINSREVFAQSGTHTTTLDSRELIEASGVVRPSKPELLSPYDAPHMKGAGAPERVFLRVSTRAPRKMVFLNVRNVAPGERLATVSIPLAKVVSSETRLFLSSVAHSPFAGRSVHAHLVLVDGQRDLEFAQRSGMRELNWSSNAILSSVRDPSGPSPGPRTFRVAAKFEATDGSLLPLVVSLAIFRDIPIDGAEWTACRRFQSKKKVVNGETVQFGVCFECDRDIPISDFFKHAAIHTEKSMAAEAEAEYRSTL